MVCTLDGQYQADRGAGQHEYRRAGPPEVPGIVAHHDYGREAEPGEQRDGHIANRVDPFSQIARPGAHTSIVGALSP
jgi:hypothetical protein